MKWEEIIAEARAAGVLAFCADGIAVLKRADAESSESGQPTHGETGEKGRKSGDGQSESPK
jgi:hypothetical protein